MSRKMGREAMERFMEAITIVDDNVRRNDPRFANTLLDLIEERQSHRMSEWEVEYWKAVHAYVKTTQEEVGPWPPGGHHG